MTDHEAALRDRIAAIWAETLARTEPEPDQDFFYDLDGQSLAAAVVIARIADTLAVPLEVSDLYAAPTVRLLAERAAAVQERLRQLGGGDGAIPQDATHRWARALVEINARAAMALLADSSRLSLTQGDVVTEITDPDEMLAFLRRLRGQHVVLRTSPGDREVSTSAAGAESAVPRHIDVTGNGDGHGLREVRLCWRPIQPSSAD